MPRFYSFDTLDGISGLFHLSRNIDASLSSAVIHFSFLVFSLIFEARCSHPTPKWPASPLMALLHRAGNKRETRLVPEHCSQMHHTWYLEGLAFRNYSSAKFVLWNHFQLWHYFVSLTDFPACNNSRLVYLFKSVKWNQFSDTGAFFTKMWICLCIFFNLWELMIPMFVTGLIIS